MPNDSPDWLAATDIAPLLLGTVTVPAGQAGWTTDFTVPPTATALLLVFPGGNKVASWHVRGVSSNAMYAQVVGLDSNSAMAWCPVVGQLDGQVSVAMNLTGVQGADNLAATVFAYTGAGFAAMFSNQNVPVIVKFASTPAVTVSGQPIGVTVSGQPLHTIVDSAAATLPVSEASWPGGVSGLTSKTVLTDIAANGTSSVLAAAAGKVVTIYAAQISVAPVTPATTGNYGLQLQSITSTQGILAIAAQDVSAAGWQGMSENISIPMGLPLPVGEGVQLRTDGLNAGSARCRATIVYTQA